jgi:DNA polymerase-3 subunit gamma/tau
MSYQVLARRWRPKTFSELVGQEHVVRALSNALDNDRLHHAYLFTGTRGVGKTTIARILSKSLNCETGVGSQPCGECSVCREVDEGRFVDLIEVDAASKTGVDDTRELLDNVPYAPVRGRYKVYLIDEVHMFSNHSFNALLKTLEEPPPHVKFLLATTDPQKVPVTVLSRCLQFGLNRLPIEQIEKQFEHILGEENIQADKEALYLIARAADGSMRDGLSLLDQAIAFGGGSVQLEPVRDMLGVVAADELPKMLADVHAGDGHAVVQSIQALAQAAPDFSALLKDLLTLLHRLSLLKHAPDAWQSGWGDVSTLQSLADQLTPEDIQLYYQIGLVGQRDITLAPDMQSGFEMVLLRMMAFHPGAVSKAKTPKAAPVKKPAAPQSIAKPESELESQAVTAKSVEATKPVQPKEEPVPAPTAEASSQTGLDLMDWHKVLPRLEINGMAAQLAANCMPVAQDGNLLTLSVAESFASMMGSAAEKRLLEALQRFAGNNLKLKLQSGQASDTPAERAQVASENRQQQAENDVLNDPFVRGLQETFDAEVVAGSIRAIEPK